jgi:hypothetical protein
VVEEADLGGYRRTGFHLESVETFYTTYCPLSAPPSQPLTLELKLKKFGEQLCPGSPFRTGTLVLSAARLSGCYSWHHGTTRKLPNSWKSLLREDASWGYSSRSPELGAVGASNGSHKDGALGSGGGTVTPELGPIGARYRFHKGLVGGQDGSIGARIKTTGSQNGSRGENPK